MHLRTRSALLLGYDNSRNLLITTHVKIRGDGSSEVTSPFKRLLYDRSAQAVANN